MLNDKVEQSDLDYFASVNVILNINGEPAAVGSWITTGTIELVGINNYIILNAHYQALIGDDWGDYYDTRIDFVLVDGGLSATAAGVRKITSFYVETVENAPTVIEFYEFTDLDIAKLTDTNTALTINDIPVVSGSIAFFGDTLRINILDSDHFFELNESVCGVNFTYSNGVISQYINFIIDSVDDTEATLIINEILNFVSVESFNVSVVKLSVAGANNIYLVNDDIVQSVNDNRYVTEPDSTLTDLGQYILSLKQYPFIIPDNYIDESRSVLLAKINTGVLAPSLNDDSVYLDLGSIIVEGEYLNALDLLGVEVILHLPFLESVTIQPEYVVGHTLSIIYKIDLYSGSVLANISSTFTDGVFSEVKSSIGVNVPYVSGNYDSPKNLTDSLNINNDLLTPYVEIIKDKHILPNGFYTIPVIVESVLTGQTGFVRIEDINLQSNASKQNKELLISLLKEGVIIND